MNSLSPTLFQSPWQETDSFQDISEVQEDGKAAHGMGEENTERLEALGQCIEQQQQNVQLSHQHIYDDMATLCSGKEEED